VDSVEAKQILACYRPGRDDPAEPNFAEALEQARRDPELGRWLIRQTALDARVMEALERTPVPPDLRHRILAHRPARRFMVGWGARELRAAAVVLVALATAAGFWLLPQPATFASYRDHMARLVSGDDYEMTLKSNDLQEIRRYLAGKGWPSDYALTRGMQHLEAEGASVLEWHGRRVSMICLRAEADRDLFVFVLPRALLPDAPVGEPPQLARVGKMMTAAWASGDDLYLLAGAGDEEFLRQNF
jgi:hypothetical protein